MHGCQSACSGPPATWGRSCCDSSPVIRVRRSRSRRPSRPRASGVTASPSSESRMRPSRGPKSCCRPCRTACRRGAGRALQRDLLFGEVAEDFRAYAAGNEHRHLPELRATLARESGFTGDLVFTPHLLPVKRGILETIHVPLTRAIDRTTAEGIYDTVYADEPCVSV